MVLLAVFAASLRRLTGNERTAVRVYNSHRLRHDLRNSIGCRYQDFPILLTVPVDTTMTGLIEQTKQRVAPVYRYGRCDYHAVRDMLMRRQYARGVNLETMVAYNYVSDDRTAHQDRPDDSIVFSPSPGDFTDPFALVARQSASHLTLRIRYHAHLLPRTTVERFLSGLHRLLLGTATTDGQVADLLDEAGLPAPAREGRWTVRDGCRISLDDIERLLRSHPTVDACHVTVAHQPSPVIVGYVTGAAPDPFCLRNHLTARLKEYPAAVVPDLFVAVADGDVTTGTGYDAPAFDADTPEKSALDSALAATSPGASWSKAASYLTAGGSADRIEAFLIALADRGFTGVEYADLYGHVPPGDLAGSLTRAEKAPGRAIPGVQPSYGGRQPAE